MLFSLDCALTFARRVPTITHLANKGLGQKVEALSSNYRQECRGFDGSLGELALEFSQLPAQEARFIGILDGAAFQHAAEHDAGGV